MSETVHRPILAAVFMTGTIASFTAMAIAARQIQGQHDTFEIMAARSLIGLVLVVGVLVATGRLEDLSLRRVKGHLLRNLVHFTGQNLWFLALGLAPLAQVFALEFTAPLWVILLSPLLLGERLVRLRVLAVALGLAGILVITRPWSAPLGPGVLAAAASALFFALTSILTKRLTREETILSILFWLTLIQAGLGLLAAAADGQWRLPTAASLPWLVVIGICGVSAHFCLTHALRLAPASFVTPIDFARLPVIALLGAWLYGEALDPWVLIGGGLILCGIFANFRALSDPGGRAVPK